MELYPQKTVIDYADYLVVEDWYLYKALDKNVANVVNKAKLHQNFLEELLFLERKTRFDIDKEGVRYFYINGLIKDDENGNGLTTVLVVHKSGDQMPGPGFFHMAQSQGRDISDPVALWMCELNGVYDRWSKSGKK